MCAARGGYIGVVRVLINLGANVNTETNLKDPDTNVSTYNL